MTPTLPLHPMCPTWKLKFLKDTEFYCGFCGVLFMVSKKPIFYGSICTPNDFYKTKGQAPFKSGEKLKCLCGNNLGESTLIPKGKK